MVASAIRTMRPTICTFLPNHNFVGSLCRAPAPATPFVAFVPMPSSYTSAPSTTYGPPKASAACTPDVCLPRNAFMTFICGLDPVPAFTAHCRRFAEPNKALERLLVWCTVSRRLGVCQIRCEREPRWVLHQVGLSFEE